MLTGHSTIDERHRRQRVVIKSIKLMKQSKPPQFPGYEYIARQARRHRSSVVDTVMEFTLQIKILHY